MANPKVPREGFRAFGKPQEICPESPGETQHHLKAIRRQLHEQRVEGLMPGRAILNVHGACRCSVQQHKPGGIPANTSSGPWYGRAADVRSLDHVRSGEDTET